jgi:hypothetical protein
VPAAAAFAMRPDPREDTMDNRYTKTPKGIEAVEKRTGDMPRKLRTALLLVFASKTEDELRQQAAAIGAPPDFVEQLLAGGFIERLGAAPGAPVAARMPESPADRFIAGSRFVEQSVAHEGGFKAFFFQLKVQKCSGPEDLRALAPDYRQFMEKHAGPEAARLYEEELLGILGPKPAK